MLTPAGIRPSQGLIKEAIFNSLGTRVVGAKVLDLFAGSGALGIEALSRGAARATFVDSDQRTLQVLRQNLARLGLEGRGAARQGRLPGWLEANPGVVGEATLILLDPPYNDPTLATVLRSLDGLLRAPASVVVEHSGQLVLPQFDRLRQTRSKRYGDTGLTSLELPTAAAVR
ncbi:MAG: RsmD family RNA methyltransferase [Candidatus Dormibacteraeota bacterium]|nr:RsmD family RNA methyltransferase [Candidatus Dormibacteraeota bacterium]